MPPNIESLIVSKIRLLNKKLDRKTKCLEYVSARDGMLRSGAHARQYEDLIIEHIKECYEEISTILFNDMRKSNNMALEAVEQIVKKYCKKEKEEGSANILKLLRNDKNVYNRLDFDSTAEDVLNLKTGELHVNYQEIKNALELRKTTIRASRTAWFSAIAAAISALCALFALLFR